jgi:hypothetical protein
MKSGALHSPSLREQLSRGLPRDKSDTLLLIGACALVMIPHAWHLPAWVTLAPSAATGCRRAGYCCRWHCC